MYFSKLLSFSLLGATLVWAQAQPGTTTTPSAPAAGAGGGATTGLPTTGGTTGNSGRTTSPFPQQIPQQSGIDSNELRPIFLSGKVRMDDGSAPPEPVTIERLCAGRGYPIPEGYTDTKGGFSFQVGQRMGMMPDASMGNETGSFGSSSGSNLPGSPGRNSGVSERDLMGCELRATLAGYRSNTISLAGRRSLDSPDVGTIILRRLGDVSGFTTSATSMMAPKDAKKALEKARNVLKKNKLPEAQKELETAVILHPKYAEAWFELGRVQAMQNQLDLARQSYTKSVEADDKYVRPYLGLAVMEAQQQKWVEVKQLSEKVIKLNRYDFPAAFFYAAVANFNLRDNEQAEKLCRAGLEADPFHSMPKMSHLLGMLLADKQDYKGATDQLAAYLKFAPKALDAEAVKKQLADYSGKVAQAKP